MVSTDDIMNVAVLGFTIGVAAKTFNLFSKPLKKSTKNIKNIWGI